VDLSEQSQAKKHAKISPHTVQNRQRVRLVPHMHRESILYVTDTMSIASFLADFYASSTSATLEYIEYAGILLPEMQTQITRKNLPKMK
jgi:hypothetical protein